MAVEKARDQEINLLVKLIRAEAEGEGEQGMLMVGNDSANDISAHAFEATQHGYFYQKARERDVRLAKRSVDGERLWPADL